VAANSHLLTKRLPSTVARGGVLLLINISPVADQDLGKPIDLSYDTVDLTVFRTIDRDLCQGSREEMAGWT
jgi:hypothetical protein